VASPDPTFDFSVVIPGYNRVVPLRSTLRSAADAARLLPPGSVEIILVDDGSSPPLAQQLADFDPGHPVTHLRQPNQGSIIARLTGLAAARGRRVLFLDSDDLVTPDFLLRHHESARLTSAELIYNDMALATLGPGYTATYLPGFALDPVVPTDLPSLLLHIQPAPHAITYDRAWLVAALSAPLFAPERRMDPAGDVWLYYNLATHSARIAKLDAPLSAVGPHEQNRYSLHWEKLGLAALLVAEAFVRSVPARPDTLTARVTAGEIAYLSWRRLPHDYHPGYSRRLLALWKNSPRGPRSALGGRSFRLFAALLGLVAAGRLYRRLYGAPYSSSRTLDAATLSRLLADHEIH